MSPKDPPPIFLERRYFLPTRSSILTNLTARLSKRDGANWVSCTRDGQHVHNTVSIVQCNDSSAELRRSTAQRRSGATARWGYACGESKAEQL